MRGASLLLVAFILLTISCNNADNKANLPPLTDSLPQTTILETLGEPNGNEVKKYKYYLLFTHSKAMQVFTAYSFREYDKTVFCFKKETKSSDVPILSNDYPLLDTATYITSYFQKDTSMVDTLKGWAKLGKVMDFNGTVGKIKTIADGHSFHLFIFDQGKTITINRLGRKKDIEPELWTLFTNIENIYKSSSK